MLSNKSAKATKLKRRAAKTHDWQGFWGSGIWEVVCRET